MCNNLLRMREDTGIIHSDDLDLAMAEMEKTGTNDGLGPGIFFPDTTFSLWKEGNGIKMLRQPKWSDQPCALCKSINVEKE